jgi:hypothetical protein
MLLGLDNTRAGDEEELAATYRNAADIEWMGHVCYFITSARVRLYEEGAMRHTSAYGCRRHASFSAGAAQVEETVSQTQRWGDKLVFRVGSQEGGGKIFAQFDFEEDGRAVLSFAAGPERFRQLLEKEGVIPAPYRAHI